MCCNQKYFASWKVALFKFALLFFNMFVSTFIQIYILKTGTSFNKQKNLWLQSREKAQSSSSFLYNWCDSFKSAV